MYAANEIQNKINKKRIIRCSDHEKRFMRTKYHTKNSCNKDSALKQNVLSLYTKLDRDRCYCKPIPRNPVDSIFGREIVEVFLLATGG